VLVSLLSKLIPLVCRALPRSLLLSCFGRGRPALRAQSLLGNDEAGVARRLILSLDDTKIQAVGIAQSYCWEKPCHNWEDKRAEIRFPGGCD
jgi:hypothetical protein